MRNKDLTLKQRINRDVNIDYASVDGVVLTIDLEILSRCYDFTVDDNGNVLGLTAGDQGYEDTGIKLSKETLPAVRSWALRDFATAYCIPIVFDKKGDPMYYRAASMDDIMQYADMLEGKSFVANGYLHKDEIPYQKFMELWNTDLTENQRDIIHKLFDQLKSVSADRNGLAVTVQNKNKEIAKLEAEMEMLKQMLLEAEEIATNQSHCFAVYRNIPHEGSFVTKLFAKEAAAKDWIEAGRAFQEANPMPGRPEWNPDIEDVESFVGSQKNLDYIAKTEELNTANAGRYLDEGETFSIKQLEIN